MATRCMRMLALMAIGALLGGCGHTELKAPCSADDGVPPGYDTTPLAFGATPRAELPAPFAAARPARPLDTCGPMRPI